MTVGIRPEELALAEGSDGLGDTVALLEELGSETYVYANLEDPNVHTLDGGRLQPRRTFTPALAREDRRGGPAAADQRQSASLPP